MLVSLCCYLHWDCFLSCCCLMLLKHFSIGLLKMHHLTASIACLANALLYSRKLLREKLFIDPHLERKVLVVKCLFWRLPFLHLCMCSCFVHQGHHQNKKAISSCQNVGGKRSHRQVMENPRHGKFKSLFQLFKRICTLFIVLFEKECEPASLWISV